MNKIVLALCLLVCVITNVQGQTILIRHSHKDTAYIKEYYRKHLIIRAYESTKFNNFKYIDSHDKLVYKPNDHNNFGLGFNYRFISLNFGFYLPFASKDRNTYGKTVDIDAQTHVYVHKYIVDFFGQYYKGYYLSNAGAVEGIPPNQVVLRPDITTRDISLAVQYVFNDKRFSYNAPFYQNEVQKKSAGSFLLGAGIYHLDAKGDSALVPSNVAYTDFFRNNRFNESSNTGFGVNGGYAYTLVIKKLFFITGSLSGGVGINRSSLTNTAINETDEKVGPQLNFTTRFAAGYNSDKYFAGITYIRLVTEDNSVMPHTWQEVNTGNFRFIVAKRFRLKKALIPKSELIEIE